jgi:hypothetical protein
VPPTHKLPITITGKLKECCFRIPLSNKKFLIEIIIPYITARGKRIRRNNFMALKYIF